MKSENYKIKVSNVWRKATKLFSRLKTTLQNRRNNEIHIRR